MYTINQINTAISAQHNLPIQNFAHNREVRNEPNNIFGATRFMMNSMVIEKGYTFLNSRPCC